MGSGRSKQQRPNSAVLLSGIDAASAAAAKKYKALKSPLLSPSANSGGAVSLNEARKALRRASLSASGLTTSKEAQRASERAAKLLRQRRKSTTPATATDAAAAAAHAEELMKAHKKLSVTTKSGAPKPSTPGSKGSGIRAPGTPGLKVTPARTPKKSMVRAPSVTLAAADYEDTEEANGDAA